MNLFIFNDFWLKNICRLYIRRNLNGVLLQLDLNNEGHREQSSIFIYTSQVILYRSRKIILHTVAD